MGPLASVALVKVGSLVGSGGGLLNEDVRVSRMSEYARLQVLRLERERVEKARQDGLRFQACAAALVNQYALDCERQRVDEARHDELRFRAYAPALANIPALDRYSDINDVG